MLQQTKELVRAGNGPEDYAAAQKFAIAFANQERVAIDMFPTDRIFVAEVAGAVVGAVVIRQKDDAQPWQLILVYVSGGYRLGGIGKALVRAAIDHIGPGVELLVKSTLNTQGFFYQKLGWKPVDYLIWKNI